MIVRLPNLVRFLRALVLRTMSLGLLLGILANVGCNTDRNPHQQTGGTTGQREDGAERPPTQRHAATFVDQNVPMQMITGQSYKASIRMRNTGAATWVGAESYRIGSVNPLDNDIWGFHRVPMPVSAAPGTTVTFALALNAPQMPGQYNFQWRMVQDGVEWFGDETPNVVVTVTQPVSNGQR